MKAILLDAVTASEFPKTAKQTFAREVDCDGELDSILALLSTDDFPVDMIEEVAPFPGNSRWGR
ncbi:hypothetical protein FIU97_02455 [Roseivivax sp. THAF40]|uniref:hypothetical protein n=1 Tax=Roseivivax sp. THAF40 TaxID=2587858 RepID=UPI001267E842|nr:hypothetical protein [Roseivivax sp. THAF40]QFT45428.1 hypothetical protein FIU97_02455 [Roseivivax sp. THAF40]